jgi:hypothetical protein
MMNSDELLFLCELIHIQPDREKRNVLIEEVLTLLLEGPDPDKTKACGQSGVSCVSSRAAA